MRLTDGHGESSDSVKIADVNFWALFRYQEARGKCYRELYKHSEQARTPHTRTEGRATVWGFEFTTKAATLQGRSEEFVPGRYAVALGPVVTRARVSVHEVSQAEELAERRRAQCVYHAGLEVEEHCVGTHVPPEAS
jgi:hypothetical protein